MKTIVLAILALMPLSLFAASPQSSADYPLTVRVVASRAIPMGVQGGTWDITYQQIDAVVDGQRLQLGASSLGVLALGSYPARMSSKVHGPHNPNNYDLYEAYDLLMPDGKVRTFDVTGIGDNAQPKDR